MRLIFGVGINDAGYVVRKNGKVRLPDGSFKVTTVWECKDYSDWSSMIERGYSERYKMLHKTYKDVKVIDEWHLFSEFKKWKTSQGNVSGKELDKDIIFPNNKLYSPEACVYVLPMTNTFISVNKLKSGEWPIGVCWNKRVSKFQAQCSNPFTKKRGHIGYFSDPEEAHEAWRKRKHELAQLVADTETDPRVVEALKRRYSLEDWYKYNHD